MAEQASLVRLPERRARPELARCGRRRAGAPRRAGGRGGGADGAAPSRGRASRRRPCARGGRPRSRGARRRPAAGRERSAFRMSASRTNESTTAARPACEISAARNSKKPSSSSASRRRDGVSADGSASSAASTVRTWTWSLPPKRSTRPSTRTASPSSKRWSSRSTSFQTRASTRPLASTSSSARYGRACTRASPLLSAPPRTRPRRSCPRRARRWWSRLDYMARAHWYARCDGRHPAVSRRPLRRRGRRAGRSRRSAVRRGRRRGARGAVHAQPVQRRPRDASRVGGRGWAGSIASGSRRCSRRGRRARGLARGRGVRRPGRRRARAPRRDRLGRGEPYADGGVLPHERTHPRVREERRRLLRETRVQPEPILLLADGR